MSYPMLRRNMKQMLKVLLLFVLVLSMYFGVVVYMYNPDIMDLLAQYQKMMPQIMAAMGMSGITNTLLKFMNNYLYGFLMEIFPFLFLLILGNQFLMKYINSGSLACVLATPNSRKKIITTQLVSFISGIILLIGILTVVGIVASQCLFPGELEIGRFVRLNASELLLQITIGGIIFFAACVFDESKNYYMIGCGIPLLFFLFNMLSQMGDQMEWLKYVSIYTLFPANEIVNGESGLIWYHIVLFVIAILLYGIGIRTFLRKDFRI